MSKFNDLFNKYITDIKYCNLNADAEKINLNTTCKCKQCGNEFRLRDLDNDKSIKKYKETGFCQQCQDDFCTDDTENMNNVENPARLSSAIIEEDQKDANSAVVCCCECGEQLTDSDGKFMVDYFTEEENGEIKYYCMIAGVIKATKITKKQQK